MGRVSIVPQLEQKIGQPLKPWLTDKIRKGTSPQDIAAELGIGKTALYKIISEFDLKSVQKEVRKAAASGNQAELGKHIETYLNEKKLAGLSEISIQKDRDLWHAFIWWLEYAGKPVTLFSLMDVETIRMYFNYLTTVKERFGRKRAKFVGKSTINTYRGRMNAFVHWLQTQGIVSDDPKANPFKKLMRVKMGFRHFEDMANEILKMVLDSYDNSFEGIRDKTLAMFFLETGMRLGGMVNVKMSSFDWERGVGKVIEKGMKQRTIVLSDKLKVQVKKYAELRAPRTKALHFWIRADGKPLTDSGIYQIVEAMNDVPGVQAAIDRLNPGERFHPHLFRHIWAKSLAQSEVPAFAMMVMGGWEDLELVQHYAAAYSQEKAWSYINTASPLNNIV